MGIHLAHMGTMLGNDCIGQQACMPYTPKLAPRMLSSLPIPAPSPPDTHHYIRLQIPFTRATRYAPFNLHDVVTGCVLGDFVRALFGTYLGRWLDAELFLESGPLAGGVGWMHTRSVGVRGRWPGKWGTCVCGIEANDTYPNLHNFVNHNAILLNPDRRRPTLLPELAKL